MKTLGYFAAILGGAVAGATAALLLAPEKGEDTRAKIQSSVKDLLDKYKVQETIKDFCDKHNITLSKKQVEELVDEVVEA
ncbi:MAG: YtxH domain-containing protein [Prevotella sp.]|nr:YtxH domain-containing protein [Prevotella sp.]